MCCVEFEIFDFIEEINQPQYSQSWSSNLIFILVLLLWLSLNGLCVCYSASNISQNSKAFHAKSVGLWSTREKFFLYLCVRFLFIFSFFPFHNKVQIGGTQSETKILCSVCNFLKESKLSTWVMLTWIAMKCLRQ